MSPIYQAKGITLIEQYYDAGTVFAKEIKKSVRKIEKSRSTLLKIRRNVGDKTWVNLKDKSELKEFVACFVSWCEGAQITPEQGMWLMADNLSGCQTVIARYGSGVVLLHTEEEFRDANHIELHMTSPHTMSFGENGTTLTSLVYNNLFPGAGLYGWQKDKIVGVDSIFLREDGIDEIQNPVLANVIAWLVWRMKPTEAGPDDIIALLTRLGTLVDGYAINVVRKVEGITQGYKLIVARDESHVSYLGEGIGSYLKQVNIIDRDEVIMKWVLPPRNIWRGGYRYFSHRIKTLKEHVKQYGIWCNQSLNSSSLRGVHLAIQGTIYEELAKSYVHEDLGAVCVGFVDTQTGTSVSCKLNDGKNLSVIEYLDWLK